MGGGADMGAAGQEASLGTRPFWSAQRVQAGRGARWRGAGTGPVAGGRDGGGGHEAGARRGRREVQREGLRVREAVPRAEGKRRAVGVGCIGDARHSPGTAYSARAQPWS